MPASAILVIDNHKPLQRQVEKHLTTAGYRVVAAETAGDTLSLIANGNISLVLMNCYPLFEPAMDYVRSLKKNHRYKDMFLVCYSGTFTLSSHIVSAFESGADDYIVHPWRWNVFMARIQSLMRRAAYRREEPRWLIHGDIKVSPETHRVKVQNKDVTLTPKEFGLLCLLIEKKGVVLDRAFLMERIWEYSYFGTTRTVDKHVENLRNKLGKSGGCIRTVEKVGYVLE